MKNETLRADASDASSMLGTSGTCGGAGTDAGTCGGAGTDVGTVQMPHQRHPQPARPQPAHSQPAHQPNRPQRFALTTLPLGLTFTALLVLLVLFALVALCVGRFQVHPLQAVRIIVSPFVNEPITWTSNEYSVIMNVRVPRVISAILVGAALAISGASYQAVFRNPLVSPDILGVSAGACVGAAAAILLNFTSWYIQIFAFVGGIIAVLITVGIPQLMRKSSNIVMVLSGIIVGGFMSSVIGLLKYVADTDTQLPEIVYWQLGSIAKVNMETLQFTAPVLVLFIALLLLFRWRLNLLALGEAEAKTLGVHLTLERGFVIVASTILTASAVSVSGTIGWIGLIIPHVSRRIVGSDNKRLLPITIVVAAIFMLIVDTIARSVCSLEIPLSILTGFIGAPIFGYLLVHQRRVD